jgi:hypothetical protein
MIMMSLGPDSYEQTSEGLLPNHPTGDSNSIYPNVTVVKASLERAENGLGSTESRIRPASAPAIYAPKQPEPLADLKVNNCYRDLS